MTPAERDVVIERLMSAWPKPKMPDTLALLWVEHLTPLDVARSLAAIKHLETTKATRPAISDFHAAYGPVGSAARRSSDAPQCGICDNGWVEVTPGLIPTVTRCPSGCMPATPEEREVRDAHDRRRWAEHRSRDKARAGGSRPLNYVEPGARDEVELDF